MFYLLKITRSDCLMLIPFIETRLFVTKPEHLRGGINGGVRAETSMRLLAEQPAASRLAIRDLGLISHRAETRPLSPPLSLTC